MDLYQLQIGKDIRVVQGVKKSSFWKISTLGRKAGWTNFTQRSIEFQSTEEILRQFHLTKT